MMRKALRKGAQHPKKSGVHAPERPRRSNVWQLVVDADDDLSIEEATAVLRRHRIKGLTNRESVRRALQDKRIPSKRANAAGAPYRISPQAISALVASQVAADVDAGSVHKRLCDHFIEDPLHNPVSAVMAGIVSDVYEAVYVFRVFREHEPSVRAFEAQRAFVAWEAEQIETARTDTPCRMCARVYYFARKESTRVVADVTGRPYNPYLRDAHLPAEESQLVKEFREQWCCPSCCFWRAGAPVEAMRSKLPPKVTFDVGAVLDALSRTRAAKKSE